LIKCAFGCFDALEYFSTSAIFRTLNEDNIAYNETPVGPPPTMITSFSSLPLPLLDDDNDNALCLCEQLLPGKEEDDDEQ
jgi:hypothetical protein